MRKKTDGIIDEVAIKRALEGDRLVFKALTIDERDVFYKRAHRISRMSVLEAWEYLDNDTVQNPWLHFMSDCLGVKPDTLATNMRRAVR